MRRRSNGGGHLLEGVVDGWMDGYSVIEPYWKKHISLIVSCTIINGVNHVFNLHPWLG